MKRRGQRFPFDTMVRSICRRSGSRAPIARVRTPRPSGSALGSGLFQQQFHRVIGSGLSDGYQRAVRLLRSAGLDWLRGRGAAWSFPYRRRGTSGRFRRPGSAHSVGAFFEKQPDRNRHSVESGIHDWCPASVAAFTASIFWAARCRIPCDRRCEGVPHFDDLGVTGRTISRRQLVGPVRALNLSGFDEVDCSAARVPRGICAPD